MSGSVGFALDQTISDFLSRATSGARVEERESLIAWFATIKAGYGHFLDPIVIEIADLGRSASVSIKATGEAGVEVVFLGVSERGVDLHAKRSIMRTMDGLIDWGYADKPDFTEVSDKVGVSENERLASEIMRQTRTFFAEHPERLAGADYFMAERRVFLDRLALLNKLAELDAVHASLEHRMTLAAGHLATGEMIPGFHAVEDDKPVPVTP